MLKRSRLLMFATLVALVLTSIFVPSVPARTRRACPEVPPPDSLLKLYLRSDLIFVAEISSEKDGKILNDYESSYNIEVIRSLKISSALKGKPSADFVFITSEYRNKTVEEQKSFEDESDEDEEENVYYPYGYKGYSKLVSGERYLFFFRKNSESGEYELTDEVSGARKLSDFELDVHKKRLKELQSIVRMKKDQIAPLTAWLVRLAAEPSTRWDGIYELNRSFDAIEYEQEEEAELSEEEAKQNDQNRAFRRGSEFETTPAIALSLTDSQKEYLSSIAFSELQQTRTLPEMEYFYYSPGGLVRRWDKARLAMYSFSLLETIDRSDVDKTGSALNYVSGVIDDEKLSAIVERYLYVEYELQNEETTQETPVETTNVEQPETPAIKTEETPQSIEQPAEIKTEIPETIQTPETTEKPAAEVTPKAKKITAAELREQLYQEFVNRYQFLLARGFQKQDEPEEIAAIQEK